jgi:hypothetical protein
MSNALGKKKRLVVRAIEVLKKEGLSAFLRKGLAYTKLEFLILPYALIKVKIDRFTNLVSCNI